MNDSRLPHDADAPEGDFLIEPDTEAEDTAAGKKIQKLKDELEACKKNSEEYLSGWQRTKADFINAKRESEEDRRKLLLFAGEKLMIDILPVLEGYEMARANQKAWEQAPPEWKEGIELLFSKLLATLRGHGLTVISPENEPFDPSLHMAVGMEEVPDESKDGTVVTVISSGYRLHERVIRPAHVKVGKFNKK